MRLGMSVCAVVVCLMMTALCGGDEANEKERDQPSTYVGGGAIILASEQGWPQAIAVDPLHVYWTDASRVMRVPLSGGSPQVVASGQSNPVGIAVDGSSVYWTNRDSETAMKAAK